MWSSKFYMVKLFFVLSLILLNSCGSESEREEQIEKETKKRKTQEKAQFKSLAECVKAKSGGKKPTAEILKQCLSSSS